jgi:hypothetical protein
MPTVYDSSYITQRNRDKAISGSFVNRIQNTTGSAPLLGISDQSIINSVNTGQMTQYRKSNGYVSVNSGCPCNPPNQPIPPVPRYLWATRIDGTEYNKDYNITTDNTGVYIINEFEGTINVYNTDDTKFTTLNSLGLYDAFIVKYNTNGIAQWVTHIGGTNNNSGSGITVDISGLYVTGTFNETLTVYNSNSTVFTTLTSESFDAYIIKYNTNGIAQWVTTIGGINRDTGYSITIDATGVYVTGLFTGEITIYNANTTVFTTLTSDSTDAFIVKYNTNGIAQWATHIGGIYDDGTFGIITDATGIYLSGLFSGTATVYSVGGVSFTTLTSSGSYDAFIVKYNTIGVAQWATKIGGTNYDSAYGITTDATGIYVTGLFTGTATIYSANAPFTTFTLTSSGVYDAFIVKYNTNGIAQWATNIGGTNYDIGYGITTDETGVYVTGAFNGTANIYNANSTIFTTLTSSGLQDAFIVKYNTNGIAQWATKIGGIDIDSGYRITTDATGVYVTGSFNGTANIYNSNSTISTTLTSSVISTFIVKYDRSGIVVNIY